MKQKFSIIFFFIVIIFLYIFFKKSSINNETITQQVTQRISNKTKEVKLFLKKNPKYNADVFFLLDMKIPSNQYRFFVFDAKKNKITDSGLVAHGTGSVTNTNELKFNNTDGSLMTSLGKYYIGNSYNGTFGKAYKMYGLDSSNSNAFVRNIVLHSHEKMPYKAQKKTICLSWGCPMVNEKFYLRVQNILDHSDKNILMYIFY